MKTFIELTESLDDPYELTRVEPRLSYVLDEWNFEVNGVTHSIRFNKSPEGKRISAINFGIARGTKVVRKIAGIGNPRKYFATVLAAIDRSIADPSTRLKQRPDGMKLVIMDEIFEKFGARYLRAIKIRFRKTHSVNSNYFDSVEKNTNAFYLTKKGKQFTTVFSELPDISDEPEETTATEIVDEPKVSTSPKKRAPVQPIVKAPEPEEAPVVKHDPAVAAATVKKLAEKNGGKDFTKLYTEADADFGFWEFYIIGTFYTYMLYGPEYTGMYKPSGRDRNSLDSNYKLSANTYKKYLAAWKTKRETWKNNNDLMLVALNLKGVATAASFDGYNSYGGFKDSYTLRKLNEKGFGIPVSAFPEEPRKNVPIKEMVKIAQDFKSIIKDATGFTEEKMEAAVQAFSSSGYSSGVNNTSTGFLDPDESKKVLIDLLATIPEDQLDIEDYYMIGKSSKGKKNVRGTNYEGLRKLYGKSAVESLVSSARYKSVDTYLEINNMAPRYAQDDFLSTNDDQFAHAAIKAWTMTGGNEVQVMAANYLSDFGVNKNLDSYYAPNLAEKYYESDRKTYQIRHEAYDRKKDLIVSNFAKMYERSQEFFKAKFKKKYDTQVMTLYRGVSIENPLDYVPGALESWTTQLGTAKTFAKMMSRNHRTYTILRTEVPIQHCFGSFESFGDDWPGEEDLKGKKEYIVMGGTFAVSPIYVMDLSDGTEEIFKTFKEWYMPEAKEEQIKISTKVTKKSALGNDPNEYALKGLTDEAKAHYEKLFGPQKND